MADWLAAIKANKKPLKKGVVGQKNKKKGLFSFDGDDDDWGPAPDKWEPPKSQKEQAYLDMMERVEGIAKQAEEDYKYDFSTDTFQPVAEGIAEDPGKLGKDLVEEEEEADADHDLFGDGFGIDMKKKGSSHCGQYKTSRYSCETAGCKYSEGVTKTGKKTSYRRPSPPTKKRSPVAPPLPRRNHHHPRLHPRLPSRHPSKHHLPGPNVLPRNGPPPPRNVPLPRLLGPGALGSSTAGDTCLAGLCSLQSRCNTASCVVRDRLHENLLPRHLPRHLQGGISQGGISQGGIPRRHPQGGISPSKHPQGNGNVDGQPRPPQTL